MSRYRLSCPLFLVAEVGANEKGLFLRPLCVNEPADPSIQHIALFTEELLAERWLPANPGCEIIRLNRPSEVVQSLQRLTRMLTRVDHVVIDPAHENTAVRTPVNGILSWQGDGDLILEWPSPGSDV